MANPRWRDYAAAEKWARSLKLKNQAAWQKLPRKDVPADIPKDPWKVYGPEFRGWGAWLGTGTVSNRNKRSLFLSYYQAKMFSRQLGLTNQEDWWRYAKSDKRPSDVPSDPFTVYRAEWESWGAWLGTDYAAHRLTRTAVAAILGDLIPNLPYLKESELYTILQESDLLAQLAFSEKVSPMEMLQSILSGDIPHITKCIQAWSGEQLETAPSGDEEDGNQGTQDQTEQWAQNIFLNAAEIATEDGLTAVDTLAESGLALSENVIENLVQNRVAALWDYYGHAPDAVQVLIERQEGHWYGEIVRRFQEQLDEVTKLPVPSGWSFSLGGTPVSPNAMQRRTAILVRDGRRVMNLSTAGAGKTASAVLASRIIEAQLTVVVTNLSTIDGWGKEIDRAFPNAPVFTNVEECAESVNAAGRYLLVNYDKFQGFSHAIVMKIASMKPDFLVLDEMHFVKKRSNDASQRRVAVEEMVALLAANNPNLHVLGMSATPSINNLRESKTLLELITGRRFPSLKTRVTVDNALAMHQAITRHGFRFRYRTKQELREETVRTLRNDLLTRLLNMGGGVLDVERLFLNARLDAVRSHLRRGTIIYTQYVDGMVEPIKDYVAGLGLTAGMYTGSEKNGLDAFVAQEVDVLIGSAPVAVGLNGLQHVSNCLVVVSLPWTYAHYEQLVGRIHRQGSPFYSAEVIVPLVTVEVNGHEWSWDQERMRLLQTKRTLSDCVLDGVIPEMTRMSHEDLLRQSRETLNRWAEEVAQANATETNGTATQSG